MSRIVPFEIFEVWRQRRFDARDHARWIECEHGTASFPRPRPAGKTKRTRKKRDPIKTARNKEIAALTAKLRSRSPRFVGDNSLTIRGPQRGDKAVFPAVASEN